MKSLANKAGPQKMLPPGSDRLKPVRVVVIVLVLLALVEVLFLGDAPRPAEKTSLPGQAASATQVPSANSLSLSLPNSKEEAQNFARQHASLFNFDEVARLRLERAVALGQVSPEALSSAGSGLNLTPAPTKFASNFSNSITPRPTNAFALPPGAVRNAYTPPSGTCNSTASTNVVEDQYDTPPRADDNYTGATTISAIADAIPQNHSLTLIGITDPSQGDVDWVKFQMSSTAVSQQAVFNITTGNLQPASSTKGGGIDTVIELYRWDTRGAFPTSPIKYNDDFSTSSLSSAITYQSVPATSTTVGDDNSSIVFYVKIYGALNSSCTGTYQISVNYTISNTPTATANTPTVTVTPDPCRDIYEDDSNSSVAKELRTTYTSTPAYNGGTPGAPDSSSSNNNIQLHSICPTGDIDWVYIDLIKGKPYSIFTSNLTGGLDTLLVLFEKDPKGNFNPLYSSDDFPGMGLASRVDFVVPAQANTATGEFVRYYVAVKDVAGHGVPGMSYNLTLSSPGSPKNDCIDYYEPDGLQYLAKEILINDIQNHTLCPNGDADWVKFFAKAGRTYTLKTRFDLVPGMDTSLEVFVVGFDPNDPTKVISQDLLGSNDDVSVSDLSSQVDFTVPADGIYYAQVKNKGDIGRAGFYYQLSFGTGGVSLTATPSPAATNTPSPTVSAGNMTATAAARATATALATKTPTTGTTLLPQKFGDPAFQHLWDYSDRAVAQNQAQRSWEWGPKPGVIRQELYANSPEGVRQVQYFDKSRMEINNPKGNRTSEWFVSNGLLVREMISGQIASGDTRFEPRAPARLQMAGDPTPDNPAPTYAQFATLITNGDQNRAVDLTGQSLKAGLGTDGTVVNLSAPPETLRLSNYISETGHNIPKVFYDYMTGQGTIFDNGYKEGTLRNWVFSMGYPLSEAYWVKARVNGQEKDVLVQVFERRVLTYTPSNPVEWRVEMANVGQHYYLWRYNQNLSDQ